MITHRAIRGRIYFAASVTVAVNVSVYHPLLSDEKLDTALRKPHSICLD